MGARAPGPTPFDTLSDRERQVIGLAAAGLADKQIGAELDVSLNTLRTYWTRIREKVGDVSRPALVAAFVTNDLAGIDSFDPLQHQGWVMDTESRMILATDEINDDHGLPRGIPHDSEAYTGTIHPEDVERVRDTVYGVADGTLSNVNFTWRMVTPRGVEVVNSSIYGIRDKTGRVKKVYGFRVRTLDCRPGHDASVRIGHWEEDDYESEFFTVDEEMAAILGAPHAGRISRSETMTWKRHPDDDAAARKACEDAVAARREHLTTDVRLLLADGSTVWGRAKRRFVYQQDGRVHIYGTFSVFA